MEPMVGGQSRTGVVVGIDGAAPSRPALTWAADWAAARGLPLHVLTAQSVSMSPTQATPPGAGAQRLRSELQARLVAETAGIDAAYPHLLVTLDVVWASPSAALLHAGREAAAIVVGTRGLAALPGIVLGSVSAGVAGQADCPVVVVPREWPVPAADAPVVVGVDGSPESRHAVGFAADEAARRGVRLVALSAWEPPIRFGVAVLEPIEEPLAVRDEQAAILDDAAAVATAAHPGLDVEAKVAPGSPSAVLARASATACLVVVGSRGRGGVAGLLLGSVSRDLLRAARGPVAVLRAPQPA